MNIWDHSRLSKRKFGGIEQDYFRIHKFIDSSKLFFYNSKHRLLLHNLYGIEMAVLKFGDLVLNSDSKNILVRDIVAEHCKEDLSGKVPSLNEWLSESTLIRYSDIEIPKFNDVEIEKFVILPYQRSNLKCSLILTLSNFGIYLAHEILGREKSYELQNNLKGYPPIEKYLKEFHFKENWQFTPLLKEIDWLKNNVT